MIRLKKGRFRLNVYSCGGFLFTLFDDCCSPSRVFEVWTLDNCAELYIDFWDRLDVELKCYPSVNHHKFIVCFSWGVYGMDLFMNLYRNKWGFPRLSFSKEIYD